MIASELIEPRKARASAWFEALRNRIVTAFEQLEMQAEGLGGAPGTFALRNTHRVGPRGEAEGGGLMSVMRGGRVFEKVGVNISTVWGELGPEARRAMAARGVPGLEADPRFWASGISLVAHMQNPHVPAVHMNTRMFWTPGAWWFGGGADLNPAIPYDDDTAAFHGVLQAACDSHDEALYPRFKAWADSYFYIPHRHRARGVGGIFFDDLNSGAGTGIGGEGAAAEGFATGKDSWEADFAFVQSVGEAFLPAFVPVVQRRLTQPATQDDREKQLFYRGLYAEYNLVYDRGTRFGLATGHDPEAVLMSLPPVAKWF